MGLSKAFFAEQNMNYGKARGNCFDATIQIPLIAQNVVYPTKREPVHCKFLKPALLVAFFSSGAIILTGCGGPPGGASDVATLRPVAWDAVEVRVILFRTQRESSGALLLAGLSFDQFFDDRSDDILGNGAHGAVYRFDPETESFTLVSDSDWAQADGKVSRCHTFEVESGFTIVGGPALGFDGTLVPTPGGVLVDFFAATDTSVIAAVSTSGNAPSPGLFLIPSVRGTGQLFHRMFSMIDGSPIGPSLRLPFSRPQIGDPEACWSSDDQYVIYFSQFSGNQGVELLSVVPVGEALGDAFPPKMSDIVCIEYAGPRSEFQDRLAIRTTNDGQTWLLAQLLAFGETRDIIYALDSGTGLLSTRAPAEWTSLETLLLPFALRRSATSPLQVPDDGRAVLLFDGTERVIDGRVPFRVERAFERDVAVVVSTDGRAIPRQRILGQLFHQLHWEDTGEPIGRPLRIGISRPDPSELRVGWTPDERFVLYLFQPHKAEAPEILCVAPVDEVVRSRQPIRTSDVPCLDPLDWPDQGTRMLVRRDVTGEGALLFTHLTEAQDESSRFGVSYNGHGAVYRYDPETEQFSKVQEDHWDSSDTRVINCTGGHSHGEFFSFEPCVTGVGLDRPELRRFHVAGGTTVELFPATARDVSAILTTDRIGIECIIPAPGQHLHQLYSNLNGEPVGEVLRVGVGGMAVDVPDACWTEDDEYVIYYQQIPGTLHFDKLCVVDASR